MGTSNTLAVCPEFLVGNEVICRATHWLSCLKGSDVLTSGAALMVLNLASACRAQCNSKHPRTALKS